MLICLIGGNKVIIFGIVIEEYFLMIMNWGMGLMIGVVLIIVMVIIMWLIGSSKKCV